MSEVEPTSRRPSSNEKRAATDTASLEFIDKEALEREKKTERLRALRLAKEDVLLAEAKARKLK